MEKQLKTEIRKLLTGRTIRDEDGWLIAIPEGNHLIYHGVTDRTGYRRIRLWEKQIQLEESNEEAFYPILNALQSIGILVDMKTKPDALCALCRMFLTKTVLLCVEPKGDGIVHVQAYTGRSLLAGISCRRAMSKLLENVSRGQETETQN